MSPERAVDDPGGPAGFTGAPQRGVDHRRHVSDFFRLERWEIPSEDGAPYSGMGGRAPIDAHVRGAGGGMRIGSLLTSVDSLGGMMAGLAALPQWIVTSNMMATVAELDQVGPLRLDGRILRRGKNIVVAVMDVYDEGAGDRMAASVQATFAVLDPGGMDLTFVRPFRLPMPEPQLDPPTPEEFFRIVPGEGTTTTLELADELRNPWGILHGGAVAMLADVAACRATAAITGRDIERVAGADTVLHYLRPTKVGPVEARCDVFGHAPGRTLVRVAIHDRGADDRLVALGSLVVLDVE